MAFTDCRGRRTGGHGRPASSLAGLASAALLAIGCVTYPESPEPLPRTVLELRAGDGTPLHVEVQGDGESALVVPLACWFAADLGPLAHRRRLITYDPRGRGLSGATVVDPGEAFERDVADLETLRARLGLERISLIGWSYFAAVAAQYAARYPERVERLVLLGPIPPRRTPHWEVAHASLLARQDPVAFGVLREMLDRGVDESDPPAFCRAWTRAYLTLYVFDPESLERLRSDLCSAANERPDRVSQRMQAVLDALGDWDWREDVGGVQAPSLVVHGEAEFVPLEGSREWSEALPDARLRVLEACGHLPWIERPDEFFPLLDEFLPGTTR